MSKAQTSLQRCVRVSNNCICPKVHCVDNVRMKKKYLFLWEIYQISMHSYGFSSWKYCIWYLIFDISANKLIEISIKYYIQYSQYSKTRKNVYFISTAAIITFINKKVTYKKLISNKQFVWQLHIYYICYSDTIWTSEYGDSSVAFENNLCQIS